MPDEWSPLSKGRSWRRDWFSIPHREEYGNYILSLQFKNCSKLFYLQQQKLSRYYHISYPKPQSCSRKKVKGKRRPFRQISLSLISPYKSNWKWSIPCVGQTHEILKFWIGIKVKNVNINFNWYLLAYMTSSSIENTNNLRYCTTELLSG